VKGRRHQSTVAAGAPEPFQVCGTTHTTAHQESLRGTSPAKRRKQRQVHTTAGSHPSQIQYQQHDHSGRYGASRQAQRIRLGFGKAGMRHRTAQPEIEAEDDAIRPDRSQNGGEVVEGPQGLEADDHSLRTQTQQLECACSVGCPGIYQQAAGRSRARQVPQEVTLDLAALDRVEIGDVALAGAQQIAVGLKQRSGVADDARRQCRRHRHIAHAISLRGQHRGTVRQIEHRDELHDPFYP
jgi:hypothetical protein